MMTETPNVHAGCVARNRRDEPCASTSVRPDHDGRPRCLFHSIDPDRIERRRKGRTPMRSPPPPRTVEEAATYLAWAIAAVAAGRMDEKRAAAIEKMLGRFIDVRGTSERLDRIEAAIAERTDGDR